MRLVYGGVPVGPGDGRPLPSSVWLLPTEEADRPQPARGLLDEQHGAVDHEEGDGPGGSVHVPNLVWCSVIKCAVQCSALERCNT